MSYLIGITAENKHFVGSDGTMHITYKRFCYIKKAADQLQRNTSMKACSVYLIADTQYTQKVCEMNIEQFVNHIKTIGIKII